MWLTSGSARFPGPGSESPDDVAVRGIAGLQGLGLLGSSWATCAERHVCVVAHSRFNKLIIASLRGDVSQAAKVSQGNACVNVIDFSVGGGACRVVRLNVCDHLTSWTRPATPASVEDGLNSVMSVSVDDSEA